MIKKFFPILLLTFVNVIGFSILIPVLPVIAETYAPEISQPVYGVLLSTYSFFQFLGAPILGSLSDKYGRKPLLMVSQFGTTLSWVIFAFSYLFGGTMVMGIHLGLFIILLSRIVDGITGGNISVAQAWISDMTTKKEKTQAFGMVGAVFGVGFLFGPALGGLSSSTSLGYLGTCIVAFLISFVTLIMMHLYLPESLSKDKRDHKLEIHFLKEINILNKFKAIATNNFLFTLVMIRMAFMFVMGGFVVLIILYMRQAFNLTETGLGLTMSMIGMYSILNQAFVAPKLSRKLGNLYTYYLSCGLFFLGLVTVPLIPLGIKIGSISVSFILFMLNTYFINAGISFGMPTFKTILVNTMSEKQQGLATGIDESLVALGNSITPVLAGISFSYFGMITFYLFGAVLLVPFIYSYIVRKQFLPREI